MRRDWTTAAFLETEKHLQPAGGYKQLWMLFSKEAYLDEQDEAKELVVRRRTVTPKEMSVDSHHQPSSTVEALFAGAIDKVKAEAEEAMAQVKAEAEKVIAKVKAKTEKKARAYTDTIAKVKPSNKVGSLFLGAVAKQKAKSEAEAAEAIARVKAKAEKKAKAYTDTIGRVRAEAEEAIAKVKAKAEKKAKAYTDTIARVKTEAEEAIAEQEAKLEAEAEQKAKSEAEAAEAIARVKAEAEEKARAYTDTIARVKAEDEKAIAEQKAKSEAEAAEAIAKVKVEAEEKAKAYTDTIARVKAEAEEAAAGQKAKSEAAAEEEPGAYTDAIARVKAEAIEAIARVKAEAIETIARVKAESEESPAVYTVTVAKVRAGEKAAMTVESYEQPISETIQRMSQSLTVLPGEHLASAASGTPFCDLLQSGTLTLSAKDIMQKELVWGSADDSVQQTFAKMQQHDAGHVMVGQDGVLEGIISKSDLTGATSPYLQPAFTKWRRFLDDATLQIRIKWIMSRPVHIISPQTPIEVIMRHMCQFRRPCLPVVDQQGKVLGLVTEANILKALLPQSSPGISTSGEVAQVKPASGHPPDHSMTQPTETMEASLLHSQ